MSESSSASAWAEIAPWYDELLASGSGPHETALESLLGVVGDLDGSAVLDVACGQGMATRALASAGAAAVTGVDRAQPMIDIAAERTEPDLAICWRVDDAVLLSSCDRASFDGVTCQLGLMDIADLDRALGSIRRVLKPGGWFVFVIGHPCFLAPHATTIAGAERPPGRLVSHYFEQGFWRSTNPDGIPRTGRQLPPPSERLPQLSAGRGLASREHGRTTSEPTPAEAATGVRAGPDLLFGPDNRDLTLSPTKSAWSVWAMKPVTRRFDVRFTGDPPGASLPSGPQSVSVLDPEPSAQSPARP